MKTLLLILVLTLAAFGQEGTSNAYSSAPALSKDFSFSKKGDGASVTYQVMPSDEKMLSDAELGKAFSALGIISQPEQDKFALVFINAQPDFQFDKQKDKPFVLFLGSGGSNKITGTNATVFKRDKVKKLKVESIIVQITRVDFERLVAAENILLAYGDINYNVPSQNLKAFRGIKTKIDSDVSIKQDRELPPVNATGGEVQVKGYYRKDGTYVRPHTRSAPRRKN